MVVRRFMSLSYTPRLGICLVVQYVGRLLFFVCLLIFYTSCAGLIMTDALEDYEGNVSIGGRTITNPRFADDLDGLAGDEEELAKLVECLDTQQSLHSLRHGHQCRED